MILIVDMHRYKYKNWRQRGDRRKDASGGVGALGWDYRSKNCWDLGAALPRVGLWYLIHSLRLPTTVRRTPVVYEGVVCSDDVRIAF